MRHLSILWLCLEFQKGLDRKTKSHGLEDETTVSKINHNAGEGVAGDKTQRGARTLAEGVKRHSHTHCLTLAVKPRGRAIETSRMIFGNLAEVCPIP